MLVSWRLTHIQKTKDGIDSQFGANHIGPFLFTNLLMGKIGKDSRIVNVTSTGYETAPQSMSKIAQKDIVGDRAVDVLEDVL